MSTFYLCHNPYTCQHIASHLRQRLPQIVAVKEDRSFYRPSLDEDLRQTIATCDRFLVILTPALCDRPDDISPWMWQEIGVAIQTERCIIQLLAYEFSYQLCPERFARYALQEKANLPLRLEQLEADIRHLGQYLDASLIPPGLLPPINWLRAEYWLNQGLRYVYEGNFRAAVDAYTKAIQLSPNFTNAYNSRSAAYGMMGQYADAVADATRAIELDPLNFRPYLNRGLAYAMDNDIDNSFLNFSKAIDLQPYATAPYNNRGFTRYQIGDFTGAIDDCSKALEIKPGAPEALDSRGIAHFCNGTYDLALQDFTSLARLYEYPPQALIGLALCHYALDQPQQAYSYWKQLQAMNEHHHDLEWLAERYLWIPQVKQAVRNLVKEMDRHDSA